jgi:hypothetical protein
MKNVDSEQPRLLVIQGRLQLVPESDIELGIDTQDVDLTSRRDGSWMQNELKL